MYKIDSSTKVGQSKKLRPVWQGPYLVTKVVSPVLYQIRDRKKLSVIHHDRLKLCKDRDIPMWMRRLRHRLLVPETEEIDEVSADPSPISVDSDLNLGILFQGEDQDVCLVAGDNADSSNTPQDTGRSIDEVISNTLQDTGRSIDEVISNDSDSDESVNQGSVQIRSRRSRTVRKPKHLLDYQT